MARGGKKNLFDNIIEGTFLFFCIVDVSKLLLYFIEHFDVYIEGLLRNLIINLGRLFIT